MIEAINDAEGVEISREEGKIRFIGCFFTEGITEREVPIDTVRNALQEDRQMEKDGERWLEREESGLALYIQIWKAKAGYRHYREARLFFLPQSENGNSLIIVKARKLKGELQNLLG